MDVDVVLPVGDSRRRQAAAALLLALTVLLVFEAFAVVSTQVRSLRAQSAWQDDPYNVMVSVAMFCVPIVIGLLLLRMALCRRAQPIPLLRALGLLRAATFGLLLVLLTVVVDVISCALLTRHSVWGWGTALLTTWLAVLALLAVLAVAFIGRTRQCLPPMTAPDDWSREIQPLAELAASRFPRLLRPAPAIAGWVERFLLGGRGGVRRQPVRWSVGMALLAGLLVVIALILGEHDTWKLVPVGLIDSGAGFLLVIAGANKALGLARVAPGRPSLRSLGLAAAFGTLIAFALRDQFMSLLGLGLVDSFRALYVVQVVGALVGALLFLPLLRRLGATAWRGPSSSRR